MKKITKDSSSTQSHSEGRQGVARNIMNVELKDCAENPIPDLLRLCRPVAERASLPMAVVEAATAIVRYANPAFCRLISKKCEELIGRPFAEMVPEGNACLAMLNRVYRTGEAETYTKPELKKSDPNTWSYMMWPVIGGDQRPLGIMIQINEATLLQQQMAAMNESLLIAGIRQHELTEAAEKQNVQLQEEINERRRAEEALRLLTKTLEQRVAERTELAEARSNQLQALAAELIEAEEKERRRFADLLHDDLQQMLASARFQLQAASGDKSADPVLENVSRILEESIDKSRRLTHELSPPVMHHGSLYSAIEWLADHMNEHFGLTVHFEAENIPELNSNPVKVFVFRGVQELLFNIIKHAGVKSASVLLSGKNSHLEVTVSDQGKGFEKVELDRSRIKKGFGLISIRERARYIGGDLKIESEPGRGSLFYLTVPVQPAIGDRVHVPSERPGNAVSQTTPYNGGGLRVLFADDHKVMRQGLIRLISNQPEIQVAGEAANGREAVELALQLRPDVIVMDISMPVMDGIEATRRIKSELPGVRIIGLSMFDDKNSAQNIINAGAESFVPKTASSAELLKAIYGS